MEEGENDTDDMDRLRAPAPNVETIQYQDSSQHDDIDLRRQIDLDTEHDDLSQLIPQFDSLLDSDDSDSDEDDNDGTTPTPACPGIQTVDICGATLTKDDHDTNSPQEVQDDDIVDGTVKDCGGMLRDDVIEKVDDAASSNCFDDVDGKSDEVTVKIDDIGRVDHNDATVKNDDIGRVDHNDATVKNDDINVGVTVDDVSGRDPDGMYEEERNTGRMYEEERDTGGMYEEERDTGGTINIIKATPPSTANIPLMVRCISRLSIAESGSPLPSTLGSVTPYVHVTSDLSTDWAPASRPACLGFGDISATERHKVQRGESRDLELFVSHRLYTAERNTGVLISKKLNPVNKDDQSFYRVGEEYTIVDEIHHSICVCKDAISQELFVRKQQNSCKFQAQKNSVLVPLAHASSSYAMNIYGLIALEYDVHIFMEYCKGGCLQHNVARSVEETYDLVCEVLKAIAYIHSHGLVHGDIKPGNICLRDESNVQSLCLIDFEYVRTTDSPPHIKGHTTQFLPPWWQHLSEGNVTSKDLMTRDLWATACVAICLLTTRPPWASKLKKMQNSGVSDLHLKLKHHIADHGKDILDHLDKEKLESSKQGRQLWETLHLLTHNDKLTDTRAREALQLLQGEVEEKVKVRIGYKGRLMMELMVDKGVSVQHLLKMTAVQDKLNTELKKWTLLLPASDHIINSCCKVIVKKKKLGVFKQLKDVFKPG